MTPRLPNVYFRSKTANARVGANVAKKMKKMLTKQRRSNPSYMSERKNLDLSLMSRARPPNGIPVRRKGCWSVGTSL